MNWTTTNELVKEMERFAVYIPERSYSIKNIIINDSSSMHRAHY